MWRASADVNKLARAVTKWTRACDKRLVCLISYIHHTNEYNQYYHVGDTTGGPATLVVVVVPSTCHIPTLVEGYRKRGASQGSPLRVAPGVPLGMGYGVGGPHKNHHVVHPAAGCVCCDCGGCFYRDIVDGQKAEFTRNCSTHTSVRDRGVRKKRFQWIPSRHSSILNSEASLLSDLTTKSA